MKKILITGGCGFVGRHLSKQLSTGENEITIIDNLSTGLAPQYWPHHLNSKIDNFINEDCVEFFEKSNDYFDVVFHLAAVVEGRATIENNPLKVAKDFMIDSAMFRWAVRTNPGKIVYFSSSAAYPIRLQQKENNMPLSENMVDFKKNKIDVPDMSYGWAKLTGEYLSNLAHQKHGLKIAVYRPFSGYGEDQDLSYPFPAIIKRVISKESPIQVWGDGNQSRDFIYIDDCIKAVLDTYEKIDDASPLNLGTGIKTSFNELIKIACESYNVDCSISPQLDKPVGVYARYCNDNLQKAFGVSHVHSLNEGIKIVGDYLINKK